MKYSVNIDEEIKTFEIYSWYIFTSYSIFFSFYPYDKNDQLSSLQLVCSSTYKLSKQAVEPQRIACQKNTPCNLRCTKSIVIYTLLKILLQIVSVLLEQPQQLNLLWKIAIFRRKVVHVRHRNYGMSTCMRGSRNFYQGRGSYKKYFSLFGGGGSPIDSRMSRILS